jgi:hypothetical protein
MIFQRYIGIDYSGAETSTSRLTGLQVFEATAERDATRVSSPAGRGRKWTRKEIAHWLAEQVAGSEPVLVGIDHAFSFPVSYLDRYGLQNWDQFLDDFCQHWPTHEDHAYVDFSRENNPRQGTTGDGLRLTEKWTSSARCVFQFDCQGSVAKSPHSGLPWLHFLRHHPRLVGRVQFWPFDGLAVRPGMSVMAEVYPSIFRNRYARDDRSIHEQDAFAVAQWMKETDGRGSLGSYFNPPLPADVEKTARREGWILGIA